MLSFLTPEIQEKINAINFNHNPAKKNLTGQKFNRLTVLGRGDNYISPKGKTTS